VPNVARQVAMGAPRRLANGDEANVEEVLAGTFPARNQRPAFGYTSAACQRDAMVLGMFEVAGKGPVDIVGVSTSHTTRPDCKIAHFCEDNNNNNNRHHGQTPPYDWHVDAARCDNHRYI